MQIGAENRTKTMVAAGLGVLTLVVVLYQVFNSWGSSPASTQAATAAAHPVAKQKGKAKNTEERLDPTLQLGLLASAEQTKYSGTGRNIFVAQPDEPPAPVARPNTDKPPDPGPPQPPPPPPPPPITLKFFGFASKPGEPKKVFLAQGDDVFIAQEGDIVNRRYKILHITATSVEVEDVLYNNRQTLPLTPGSS
ncbi:MAG TPA: hypothetical protein VEI01_12180 [Terriglobales bacterium]|nr:hypothetical protein [Terriglobales bacterium]